MKKKSKVLIIDDDITNLSYLRELLGKKYELKCASSGEEGLKTAEFFKPDLILLDIMMPGIDGYEVCLSIRAHKELANIKILFLSAKIQMGEKLRGYRVGGDDYITKPFDDGEILAKIKVFLRLKYEEEIINAADAVPEENLLGILYEIKKDLGNIIYVKSNSPYCRIFSKSIKGESYKMRVTVQALEDYFKEKDLLRVHRSYLVNPKKIFSVNKHKNNELKMLVKDTVGEIALIPIGRSFHDKIRVALPHLYPA
ncbi:response regulator transcription factor [bacterium]|nr:response regulator transcription factor [bacterium]